MKEKKRSNNIASSYFELNELITRVFCDATPPGQIDAAYLFAETPDNEVSVFEAGSFLYDMKLIKKVAICKFKKALGYLGSKNWLRKLVAMGVIEKDVEKIPPGRDFPPSTQAEALGLVRFAMQKGWKSIYIVAPPLHQLRAFITTISEVVKEKSKLKVYSFPGLPQKWGDCIVHSQGVHKGTRSNFLGMELKKIEKYYRKGDLISTKSILTYLDARDQVELLNEDLEPKK